MQICVQEQGDASTTTMRRHITMQRCVVGEAEAQVQGDKRKQGSGME